MKDAYYFAHDNNAIQDPKMMMLLSKCGMSGVGFYWTIVEILHQQPDGKITMEAYTDYLEFYLGFEHRGPEFIASVKQMLSKTELLLNNDTHVWSERVLSNLQKRSEISQKRSKAGQIGGLRKSGNVANAKQVLANAKQNVAKERKGKEIKGNINISKHAPITDLNDSHFQLISTQYQVPLSFVRSCYDDMLNWHQSTGKIRKDWVATLRGFVKRDAIKIKQQGGNPNGKRFAVIPVPK